MSEITPERLEDIQTTAQNEVELVMGRVTATFNNPLYPSAETRMLLAVDVAVAVALREVGLLPSPSSVVGQEPQ